MCTLAGSALTRKSSLVVCDSFKVSMLLVSPDKKWILAGTKDNDDLSPKVFLTLFDGLTLCLCFLVTWALSCFLLLHICANDTTGEKVFIDESAKKQ